MPKVSVIIPCYNQGRYLEETVQSVLAQTCDDYEIVIVNDGSTDEFTNSLLRDYRRPKTKVIHTDNRGVSAARNTAIQSATGTYILPLDGDDLIGREYLQKAVALLDENRNIGIVTCLIEFFGAMHSRPVPPPFTAERMSLYNDLPCSSLFRRSDWDKTEGYNPNMSRGWEDWDFWLSLIELGVEVHRIPEVLFHYRIRKDSRERSIAREQHVQMYLQLYNNHPEFYENNMQVLFKEICCCQDLIASRRSNLLNYIKNPGLAVKKITDRILRLSH